MTEAFTGQPLNMTLKKAPDELLRVYENDARKNFSASFAITQIGLVGLAVGVGIDRLVSAKMPDSHLKTSVRAALGIEKVASGLVVVGGTALMGLSGLDAYDLTKEIMNRERAN
jgi:hypothetical protein